MTKLTVEGDYTELPRIMLVTRMHTGTRFFIDLLKHNLDEPFYSNHCQPHVMPQIKRLYDQGVVLVTTYRTEQQIRDSWMRRYQHLGERSNGFWYQHIQWHDWVIPHAKFVLSLDEADREQDLKVLGDYLGVELKTDWEPIV